MNSPYFTTETPRSNAERLAEWRNKQRKPLEQLFAELEAQIERFEASYGKKMVVSCD